MSANVSDLVKEYLFTEGWFDNTVNKLNDKLRYGNTKPGFFQKMLDNSADRVQGRTTPLRKLGGTIGDKIGGAILSIPPIKKHVDRIGNQIKSDIIKGR